MTAPTITVMFKRGLGHFARPPQVYELAAEHRYAVLRDDAGEPPQYTPARLLRQGDRVAGLGLVLRVEGQG